MTGAFCPMATDNYLEERFLLCECFSVSSDDNRWKFVCYRVRFPLFQVTFLFKSTLSRRQFFICGIFSWLQIEHCYKNILLTSNGLHSWACKPISSRHSHIMNFSLFQALLKNNRKIHLGHSCNVFKRVSNVNLRKDIILKAQTSFLSIVTFSLRSSQEIAN